MSGSLEAIDGGKSLGASQRLREKDLLAKFTWPEIQESAEPPGRDTLPRVLANVVDEISTNAMAPRGMVLMNALAAASAAFQHRYVIDAELGTVRYKNKPLSIWAMTIGESASGKTTTSNMTGEALFKFHRENEESVIAAQGVYQDQLKRWEASKAKYVSAMKEDDTQERDIGGRQYHEKLGTTLRHDESELRQIYKVKPVARMEPSVIYSTGTVQGIIKGLSETWPSACLMTDEGGTFFGGYSQKEENAKDAMGRFNGLWDGHIQASATSGGGQNKSVDARLSISIMVQPGVFASWLSRRDQMAADIGFLPRFLFYYMGKTPVRVAQMKQAKADAQESFSRILYEALDETKTVAKSEKNCGLPDGAIGGDVFNPYPIGLEDEALDCMFQTFSDFEAHKNEGAKYYPIRFAAARAPEQIMRVAGVFHCLNYVNSAHLHRIPKETYQMAKALVTWCLDHALVAHRASLGLKTKTLYKVAAKVAEMVSADIERSIPVSKIVYGTRVLGSDEIHAAIEEGRQCGWWVTVGEGKKGDAKRIEVDKVWLDAWECFSGKFAVALQRVAK